MGNTRQRNAQWKTGNLKRIKKKGTAELEPKMKDKIAYKIMNRRNCFFSRDTYDD